jgi:hypothetical protein
MLSAMVKKFSDIIVEQARDAEVSKVLLKFFNENLSFFLSDCLSLLDRGAMFKIVRVFCLLYT